MTLETVRAGRSAIFSVAKSSNRLKVAIIVNALVQSIELTKPVHIASSGIVHKTYHLTKFGRFKYFKVARHI